MPRRSPCSRHLRLLCGLLAACGAAFTAAPARSAPTAIPGYYVLPYGVVSGHPTSINWGSDGWLWVTTIEGDVRVMKDRDGNFAADTTVVFTSGHVWPLGLTFADGAVYMTSLGHLNRFTDTNGDHVADSWTVLCDSIPTGKHWPTDIALGPDHLLYVGVGSKYNNLPNTRPWSSSILRFQTNGAFVDVFASGFRNPYGLAFHADGSLFATDNGAGPDSNWTCLEASDELNWVWHGGNYGFPWCYGNGSCADVSAWCGPPAPCGAGACQLGNGCDGSMTPPLLLLDPHSSSDGLCFGSGLTGYDGNDLFIAQYGQLESIPGCATDFGHRVVVTRLIRTGPNWGASPPVTFASGFMHPLDVAVGPGNSLYVADYANSTIWRIFHLGSGSVPGGDGDRGTPPVPRLALEPNPARHSTRLTWITAPRSGAEIVVHDVSGRRIARLGMLAPDGSLVWNLTDESGRRVPPGIYFVRVRGAGATPEARAVRLVVTG